MPKKLANKRSLPKWEYCIHYVNSGAMDAVKINELGREGWELCGTVATPDTPSDLSSAWPAVVKFYFKRPCR